MDVQSLGPLTITGLKTRTTNVNETNPQTAAIKPLWERFFMLAGQQMAPSDTFYGIYTHYESDVNGEYDLIVGSPSLSSSFAEDSVTHEIPQGRYLVFSASGEMPQTVITLWQQIWQYFSEADCPHTRAYTSDFESYVMNESRVDIAIALKD
ncbi:GyrI-like domain-containing protein [Shewanella corallii]|uniref:GyrI-like domain-containing protein n=1 Tax=Shewanella corallii TaxID=560080 RepID=A0ABT0N738_9GAMM|nr:GyrI-like domain-containing protein [Shewanella corallii]MCL2914261.1 GyrI-like domain-containing protein [Shewanella corallii]